MLSAHVLPIVLLHVGALLVWLVLKRTVPVLAARLPALGIYHLALAGFSFFVRKSPIYLSVILVIVGSTFVVVGLARERRRGVTPNSPQ